MILETDNPTILESVKNVFVKAKQQDFWETLPNEKKQEIENGLSEILREDIVEYESVMKKHRKLKQETK